MINKVALAAAQVRPNAAPGVIGANQI